MLYEQKDAGEAYREILLVRICSMRQQERHDLHAQPVLILTLLYAWAILYMRKDSLAPHILSVVDRLMNMEMKPHCKRCAFSPGCNASSLALCPPPFPLRTG